MKVAECACELMRLIEKNRYLHPHDIPPRDRADIQTLLSAVRMIPPEYPHY